MNQMQGMKIQMRPQAFTGGAVVCESYLLETSFSNTCLDPIPSLPFVTFSHSGMGNALAAQAFFWF